MLEDMIIAKDRHKDDVARAERFRLSQRTPRLAPWLSKYYRLSLGRLAKLMVKWGDRLQARYPDRTEPGSVPEPCGPGYCRLADPMQTAVSIRVQVP